MGVSAEVAVGAGVGVSGAFVAVGTGVGVSGTFVAVGAGDGGRGATAAVGVGVEADTGAAGGTGVGVSGAGIAVAGGGEGSGIGVGTAGGADVEVGMAVAVGAWVGATRDMGAGGGMGVGVSGAGTGVGVGGMGSGVGGVVGSETTAAGVFAGWPESEQATSASATTAASMVMYMIRVVMFRAPMSCFVYMRYGGMVKTDWLLRSGRLTITPRDSTLCRTRIRGRKPCLRVPSQNPCSQICTS